MFSHAASGKPTIGNFTHSDSMEITNDPRFFQASDTHFLFSKNVCACLFLFFQKNVFVHFLSGIVGCVVVFSSVLGGVVSVVEVF